MRGVRSRGRAARLHALPRGSLLRRGLPTAGVEGAQGELPDARPAGRVDPGLGLARRRSVRRRAGARPLRRAAALRSVPRRRPQQAGLPHDLRRRGVMRGAPPALGREAVAGGLPAAVRGRPRRRQAAQRDAGPGRRGRRGAAAAHSARPGVLQAHLRALDRAQARRPGADGLRPGAQAHRAGSSPQDEPGAARLRLPADRARARRGRTGLRVQVAQRRAGAPVEGGARRAPPRQVQVHAAKARAAPQHRRLPRARRGALHAALCAQHGRAQAQARGRQPGPPRGPAPRARQIHVYRPRARHGQRGLLRHLRRRPPRRSGRGDQDHQVSQQHREGIPQSGRVRRLDCEAGRLAVQGHVSG
mmetsp:Transcript_28746/g.97931  ORF Transcript_28746/g.97931 Transcript_28746/m.97931 type:complete len:360 (+) Transcript_28746:302-1381(+)